MQYVHHPLLYTACNFINFNSICVIPKYKWEKQKTIHAQATGTIICFSSLNLYLTYSIPKYTWTQSQNFKPHKLAQLYAWNWTMKLFVILSPSCSQSFITTEQKNSTFCKFINLLLSRLHLQLWGSDYWPKVDRIEILIKICLIIANSMRCFRWTRGWRTDRITERVKNPDFLASFRRTRMV